MSESLREKAGTLPSAPGVYLFKDLRGRVLYVGKATDLRARVRQYLSGSDERFMVPFLVSEAHDVDAILTRTEKDALLLENTLIKQHRPRYNVKLRDDSNFLHLALDRSAEWPRYRLVRQIKTDGSLTFGPYHSASKARDTLAFLQRAIPLRTCTDSVLRSRSRPCLLHQMNRCVAPCVGLTTKEEYDQLLDESVLLLQGRRQALVRRLQKRMLEASEALEFEKAARFRDLIRSIEATLERQQVIDTRLADRDVWGLFRQGSRGALALVPVREGVMSQPRVRSFEGLAGDDGEILSSLVNAGYPEGSYIPPEIVLPTAPSDVEALAEVLSDRRGRKVTIRTPKRGAKLRLVHTATENARLTWLRANDEDTRREQALAELAEIVGLEVPPRRIECFDNSNLGGTNPVAAMSVFIDGKPDRREYRRYKVKTVVGSDDFATMREIIGRRIRRAVDEGDVPDLMVVDGGRGQLNAALEALREYGTPEQPVIGISKPRTERRRGDRDATDKLILPGQEAPVALPEGHPALRLVQHLRDEVHRHAVTYHRKVRRKNTLLSVLEEIPGVGPARRKALLKSLGSAAAVVDASEDQLAEVPGIGPGLAAHIYAALHPG